MAARRKASPMQKAPAKAPAEKVPAQKVPAEKVPAQKVPAEKAGEPVFVAARPMKRNGVAIRIGDVVPDAQSWPRLESWVRAGYLKEAP